ncbi:MAG: hypothetical protein ACAH21_17885 [Ramlibacter sp.]
MSPRSRVRAGCAAQSGLIEAQVGGLAAARATSARTFPEHEV